MADRRKRYVLTLGGIDHTVLLSDEGAARYGNLAKPAPQVSPVAKKAPAKKTASKKTE